MVEMGNCGLFDYMLVFCDRRLPSLKYSLLFCRNVAFKGREENDNHIVSIAFDCMLDISLG